MAGRKFIQNDNNLAVAYYRFSSHSQNEASIDQQREEAHRYAEARGLRIVREYEDAGISGTTDQRPGYQQMLAELDKVRASTLILWKTDRLGRDKYELVLAKRSIRDAGYRIALVAESIPDDEAEAALFESLLDGMAEYYSKQLSRNIRRGMLANARSCRTNGRRITGYRSDEDDHFEPDPDTAPIVQRIFEEYAAGEPMTKIAERLNEQGLKTILSRPFTVNSLRSILRNDAYTGVYRFSDVVIEGGMPALVSQDLFEQAQRKLQENKRRGARKANGTSRADAPDYWLAGKLYCGECGCPMHGVSGKSSRYFYYYCAGQRKHMCGKKPMRKQEIEELVLSLLSEILNNQEMVASLAADTAAYFERTHKDTGFLDALVQQERETQKALDNLVRALEQGVINDTVQARILELEGRKKALCASIEAEELKLVMMEEDANSIGEYFYRFLNADLSNVEMRDAVLEYFIDKIYVYDDKVTFTGLFSENAEIDVGDIADAEEEFDEYASSSTKSDAGCVHVHVARFFHAAAGLLLDWGPSALRAKLVFWKWSFPCRMCRQQRKSGQSSRSSSRPHRLRIPTICL